jgi:TRAP-type C4-dicarboxylate transport system permease small subunit
MLYKSVNPRRRRVLAIVSTASILVIFAIGLPGTLDYIAFMSKKYSLTLHIRMDLLYSCFGLFVIARHRGERPAPAKTLRPESGTRSSSPMSLPAVAMLVCFFAWCAIGMPIGFAMLTSAFLYLLLNGQDMGLVAFQSLNGLFKSFVLLAVPLFIVAADIMNAGTISERLLKFASLCVGRVRGGLAHVTVVASMIFSGMSGSAIADAAGPAS